MGPNHNDFKCVKVQLEICEIQAEREQQKLQLELVEQLATDKAQASK